jgi:hypothetical protein
MKTEIVPLGEYGGELLRCGVLFLVGAVTDFKCPKYIAMRIELNRVAVTFD